MISKEAGLHHDEGKLRVDLIPISTFQAIGDVLTYGTKKYDSDNWRKGLAWGRVYGSLLRHLMAWWSGEDFDSESGLHHLSHVLTNAAFLREYTETHPELDDRPKRIETFDEKIGKALDKTRKYNDIRRDK